MVSDPEVFETWEDYISRQKNHRDDPRETPPAPKVAKFSAVGQADARPAPGPQAEVASLSAEKPPEDSRDEYLVHFGAGARWLLTVRTSDGAMKDNILSVFSVSVSPYGIVGEAGIDLAIGKDSSFFLLPNLKFFFVKHEIISIYLEGTFALYSQPSGTNFGGGAGFGVIGGIIENLSLEFRASAVVLNLNEIESASLLNGAPEPPDGNKSLILCPSVEARLMARF
jgi:hypothetical protein